MQRWNHSLTSASLPPSPAQAAALTALQTLTINHVLSLDQADWEALRALAASGASSLTKLSMSRCYRLPTCLSALTGLKALKLSASGTSEDVAGVGPLLAPLTRLSSLWLELPRLQPPAELALLTGLQHLPAAVPRFLCCERGGGARG